MGGSLRQKRCRQRHERGVMRKAWGGRAVEGVGPEGVEEEAAAVGKARLERGRQAVVTGEAPFLAGLRQFLAHLPAGTGDHAPQVKPLGAGALEQVQAELLA